MQAVHRLFRRALSTLLLATVPALTGCLSHVRVVPKTRIAPIVMQTSLDQLVKQMDARYAAIQTMNASIEISGITGGSLQGEVRESLSLGGYLFVRRPADLRIYLKVPVVSSLALDMTSDGKTFKLYIPSRHKAVIGTNQVTTPSKNSLENLRPDVFLDSLLIHGVGEGQLVSLTLDTYVADKSTPKRHDLIEEPEYQLSILAKPQGTEVQTLRVIHISRDNLLPYKQEIYDDSGQIVTRSRFSNYQRYGDIQYPTRIEIERPLDHYGLNLTFTKIEFNGKLEDDQFDLKFPEGVAVQTMP